MPFLNVRLGDRVELRKVHPCGGREWTVTRIGADIGLLCSGCGRRVLLDREEFERRVKRLLPAPTEEPENAGSAGPS